MRLGSVRYVLKAERVQQLAKQKKLARAHRPDYVKQGLKNELKIMRSIVQLADLIFTQSKSPSTNIF